MARKVIERLSYYEARNWFWVRTMIWLVPAALVSVMAHYIYSAEVLDKFWDRVWISAIAGVCSTLIGLLAAHISTQMTWMRCGWRISYVLNGPFCAVVAGVIALLLCGIVLPFLQSDRPDPVGHPGAYQAYLAFLDRSYQVMAFAIGASLFWGFLFGSWFAMRRDKYFIEPLMG
jgi:ABC-type dipeptide/oligopeptide/nickel transport system permease component